MAMGNAKPARPLWVRLLKGLFFLILFAAAAFILLGMFVLEGKYEVSRSLKMKAAPAVIHQQVGDLREWPNWLPFPKHDKSVKTTIEIPTGIGAKQHWTGNSGNGKLTFTASDENKGIEFDMVFDEKWPAKGAITYAKAGDDTEVTWRMTGKNEDFMGKWFAVLMPYMMPQMFDEGLRDIQLKVEGK